MKRKVKGYCGGYNIEVREIENTEVYLGSPVLVRFIDMLKSPEDKNRFIVQRLSDILGNGYVVHTPGSPHKHYVKKIYWYV